MNWADEHYVKLFTRDTVTWRSWPWQSRALFPLLMRAVDGAGMLSVGARELGRSVALMVDIPAEVALPGIEGLMADGTVEMVGGDLIITKFLEAQESRKTNAQSKVEQREKAKAVARRSQVLGDTTQHRQTAADGGRSGHPPAQLSPAQPITSPSRKKPRAEKPVDPRHAPMRTALIEAFKRKRGIEYPFDYGREDAEVRRLLKLGLEPTVLAAWERALDSTYPTISTLAKFRIEFPRFVGRGEGATATPAKGASWTQNQPDDGKGFLEGLE